MVKKKEEKAEAKAEKQEVKEEKVSHKAEKAEKPAKEAKAEEAKAEKPKEVKAEPKKEAKTEVPKEGEKPQGEKQEERTHQFVRREKPKKTGLQKPKKSKALKPNFVDLKPKEIIEAIIHLANEGHSQSEIGMILRNQYGVPKVSKALGKKVAGVLKEQNLLPKMPEDLMNLIRKSVTLREHMEKNKKDMSAKRGLMLTVSKIRALEKYYKKSQKIPINWRYSSETAALLAK